MTVNPRTVATKARRRLQIVSTVLDDLADTGPTAYSNAEAWAQSVIPSSNATGNRRTNTTSAPTERAADSGALDQQRSITAMYIDLDLVQHLTAQLEIVAGRVRTNLRKYATYVPDTPIAGQESLEDLWRTDGTCPTCKKTTCTGRGGDRLRRITVDASLQKLMCDACRKAWGRRPYINETQLENYDTFAEERRR